MPPANPQGKRVAPRSATGHVACGHRRTAEGLPDKLVRLVKDVPPLHPYADKDPELCLSAEHRGQRKLLNTELEFLAHVVATLGLERCRETTVVYAGSAPGTHLKILLDPRLFGGVFRAWHLYDEPHRFDPWLLGPAAAAGVAIVPHRGHPRTPRGFFDPVIAEKYRGETCVFISDIRTDDTSNNRVHFDNEQTRKWCMLMRPVAAMVKFRLPFPESPRAAPRTYPVLRGPQVFQTWAPPRSAETRLWVTEATCRSGSTVACEDRDYETRMNTFNQFYRPQSFVLGGAAAAPAGACLCYDHAAERLIYAQCLKVLAAARGTRAITAGDVAQVIRGIDAAFAVDAPSSSRRR